MANHNLTPASVSVFQRYAKAFAALLGTLTPSAVVGLLALVGVTMPLEVAALVIGIATAVTAPFATVFGPANQEPGADVPAGPVPDTVTLVHGLDLRDIEG